MGGLEKIVSGGQTGADRAALDAARALGIPTGGFVPRGRRAEDGAIPAEYTGLVETDSADYEPRTERNVRDADATLVLGFGPPSGGTLLTVQIASALGRPHLVLDLELQTREEAARETARWLDETRPRVLNVAGPRASMEPRIAEATRSLLLTVLRTTAGEPGGKELARP